MSEWTAVGFTHVIRECCFKNWWVIPIFLVSFVLYISFLLEEREQNVNVDASKTNTFQNYEMEIMLLSRYHFQTGKNMTVMQIQMTACKYIFTSIMREPGKLSVYKYV